MPYIIKFSVLPLLNECERGKTNVFTVPTVLDWNFIFVLYFQPKVVLSESIKTSDMTINIIRLVRQKRKCI